MYIVVELVFQEMGHHTVFMFLCLREDLKGDWIFGHLFHLLCGCSPRTGNLLSYVLDPRFLTFFAPAGQICKYGLVVAKLEKYVSVKI